ncbi:DUF2637 domain-containing protein [Lentzea flaviverrucosa]|uniref:DUF2637 domain-containing protein n=1 Tax=Lentzea flaviverrucosa TaxID=200379 RepID=A0A1H9XNK2_9PSEU|nr:DUF2637 domain-containing protein [Lentzea flaviverrucosa]RDI19660.1 uncharacterized protein DUF2637 [Lentzea flaviverrucosa]SES47738.1 Protein of unknown function [Lentzea flaviverrucosa]
MSYLLSGGDPMSTDAKRLERTGRIIAMSTWAIAAVVMVYGVLTVTPWLVAEGIPEWSAWMLPPAVDAALVLALVGDRTLAQHGRTTGWGTTLRAVTGLVTLGLNIAPSALERNIVGVALHAVGPVLLWVATEAAGAYQREFTSLARELANQAGAPGEDLAAPGGHQVVADLVEPMRQAGADLVTTPDAAPGEVDHQPGDQGEPAHQVKPTSQTDQAGADLVAVPRQAGATRPHQVHQAPAGDLVDRARQVLATARDEGRQVGRTRLARELGITESQARQVLTEARRPHLAAVHIEPAEEVAAHV